VAQSKLGSMYNIVNISLTNRNGFIKSKSGNGDKVEYLESGLDCFRELLSQEIEKHGEMAAIVIPLGTNDLQWLYNLSPADFEKGLNHLIGITKELNPNGKIILIPPPILTDHKQELLENWSHQFDERSIELSEVVQETYKKVAEETESCKLFDFNPIAKEFSIEKTLSSQEILPDGLHYSAVLHACFGTAFAEHINELLDLRPKQDVSSTPNRLTIDK